MKQERKIFLIIIILFAVLIAVCLAYNRGLLFKDYDIAQNEKGNIIKENTNQEEEQLQMTQPEIEISGDKSNEYIFVKGTENFEDIELTDIKLKLERANKTELIANVENLTDKYLEAKHIRIKAIDKDGVIISGFAGILTDLAPYESITFKAYVLSDITRATNIEFEEILN